VLTRRFNFMENAAILVVMAILAYALLTRMLRYFEVAEKAAMTVTVLEVERGMRVRLALGMLQGTGLAARKASDANPFEFARATPPNYLGELAGDVDLHALKTGNWFYAKDRREIVYLPRLSSRFRSDSGTAIPFVRYRLDDGGSQFSTPRLVVVVPYQWEPEYGTF
jgi:hypothetical protein